MPIDQQYLEAEVEIGTPFDAQPATPDSAALDRAADRLLSARRPLLWLGGGVNAAGAHAEAQQVAEALGAAVFTTRGGRGAVADSLPLVIGNYFNEGAAKKFIEAADVILAVGTRFSGHATQNWVIHLNGQLIRIDIDPTELDHNYTPTIGIVGDAKAALAGLAQRLADRRGPPDADYGAEVASLKSKLHQSVQNRASRITAMLDILRESTPHDTIFVTDSTIPAYTGGNQYLPVLAPRGFVTPHSVAIGPGLPFALGAQAAAPQQPVVCIAGDGGFMLHATELATAADAKLPVIICLFNNQGYGVLRRYQRSRFEGRFIGVDLHTPDFVKLAEAMGVRGGRIMEADQLGPAIRQALDSRQPTLLDIQAPFE